MTTIPFVIDGGTCLVGMILALALALGLIQSRGGGRGR